jgi:hypothetical protein
MLSGITGAWSSVTGWLGGMRQKAYDAVGDLSHTLFNIGRSIINGLFDGIKAGWEASKNFLSGLGSKIASLKGPPSYDAVMLYENGTLIMKGLFDGMKARWGGIAQWLSEVDPAEHMDAKAMGAKIQSAIQSAVDSVEDIGELNPVITPVLDMTEFEADVKKMNEYINTTKKIGVSFSYDQARSIASSTTPSNNTPETDPTKPASGVKFEQNIYAPTQLSTSDIYRQTRTQIALAKEELSIR